MLSAGTTGHVVTTYVDARRRLTSADELSEFGTARDLVVKPDGASVWALGAGAVGWSLRGADSLGGVPAAAGAVPVARSADGRFLLAETDTTVGDDTAATPVESGAPTVGGAISITRQGRVFDMRTRRPVGAAFVGQPLGFLADGRHVVVAVDEGVEVLDVATGRSRASPSRPRRTR